MALTIGTFNLNNLFSRFNFQAEVTAVPPHQAGGIELTFTPDQVLARTFRGRLVREKDPAATAKIAARIRAMDLDVLAVQEVEHIAILAQFNRENLGGLYADAVLIEGNDPRLIDVGLLSKRPIGPVTSHMTAVHPERPGERVFGRDLVAADILDDDCRLLVTVYNTHLKSHFVEPGQDPAAGALAADARRRRQAETIGRILSAQQRRGSRFVLLGDMNDPPASPHLAAMLTADGAPLVDGLTDAAETRPTRPETPGQGPGPASPRWTHRFNPAGPALPQYELFDQIWLSPALGPRLLEARILRRETLTGDGSDHDPAWVVLDL